MICAVCDAGIPDNGIICPRCNPARAPRETRQNRPLSHHELATVVRRMKGFVLASVLFGIVIAPFALWTATKALQRYAGSAPDDSEELRQLVLLRRIAAGLLVFWAFFLGANAKWLYTAATGA